MTPLLSSGLQWSNSQPGLIVSTAVHFLVRWIQSIKASWHRPQTRVFAASYSTFNPRFLAEKRIWVWDCHATCGHWKTTFFIYSLRFQEAYCTYMSRLPSCAESTPPRRSFASNTSQCVKHNFLYRGGIFHTEFFIPHWTARVPEIEH